MPLFPLLESGGGVLRRFGLTGRGPVFSSAALWGYGEFFVWFAGIPLDLLLCGKTKCWIACAPCNVFNIERPGPCKLRRCV